MALYPPLCKNITSYSPVITVGSILGYIYVNYVIIGYEEAVINICKEIYTVLNDPSCNVEIIQDTNRGIADGALFSKIRIGRRRGLKPDNVTKDFLDISKAPLLEEKIKIFTYDIPTPKHPKDIR